MSGATTAVVATLAIAGAAVSAYSAVTAGEAQSDAATRNAQVASQNATVATQQAQANAEIQQRRAAQVIGASRAAFGASGVDGSTGSPLDVLASSASSAELDRQGVIYQGRLKAMGFQNTADEDTAAASNYLTSGYLRAGSGLLQSGASAFAKVPTGGTPYNEIIGSGGVQSPQIDPSGNYSV